MQIFVEREAVLDLLNESRTATESVLNQLDQHQLAERLARLIEDEHHATHAVLAHAGINSTIPTLSGAVLDQWRQQRAILCKAIDDLAWSQYHGRFATIWGNGYIGDMVKAVIAAEHAVIRNACQRANIAAPYDRWGDHGEPSPQS